MDSTGSKQHNLDLSLRRAKSVAAFLGQHGIPARRLNVYGQGEERQPRASNAIAAGRQLNRRVGIILRPISKE